MWQEHFSDWEYVLSLLPSGWKEQIYRLGLLKFGRKFSGENKESVLLRVLLLHLVTGVSLRETSALSKQGNLADISDVGILKRLRRSEKFFQWGLAELRPDKLTPEDAELLHGHRFRLVDATMVKEPGITGSLWRLHYAVDLRTLSCDEVLVSDQKTGETLSNFHFSPGEVAVGDRVYATPSGIAKVTAAGAEILARFTPHLLPLHTADGTRSFQLMKKLRELEFGEAADWSVTVKVDGRLIPGRVCATRRSPAGAQKERDEMLQEAKRKQRQVNDKTLELADYFLLFTTLPETSFSTMAIIRIYRLRWQIEMVFKRLKSILNLGHLHKYDPPTVRAWLTGKLFAAALIDKIIRVGESFFPW